MKKHTFLLALNFLILTTQMAFADQQVNRSESLAFELPKGVSNEWKEITREQNGKTRTYEYIPTDQQVGDWTELIAVQYFDRSAINRRAAGSIDESLEVFREQLARSYPGNKVTFRVIEKNRSEAIYEWVLHKPYKNIPPQHEIARTFLTDEGFHRIGVTRRHQEMNPTEKEKWIKFLREGVSIAAQHQDNNGPTGVKNEEEGRLFELGPDFKDWKILARYSLENGYIMISRVPPSVNEDFIDEGLELSFHPNQKSLSLVEIFKIEQESIEKKWLGKADFTIIKQSPTEIVYHYVCPSPGNKLLISGVCRSVMNKKGYFYLHYKRGLPFQLSEEEKFQWQQRLEKILINRDE